MYDVLGIQALQCSDVCNYVWFLYAFTGSNIVSRIFGIEKTQALENLMKYKQLQKIANVFSSNWNKQIDIESAEHTGMLLLFLYKYFVLPD